MPSAFGQALRAALLKRGLSQRQFALRVATFPSTVAAIIAGRIRVPKKRIELWVDALNLKGRERLEFVELAWLDHTPPIIRARLERAEKQLEKAKRRV